MNQFSNSTLDMLLNSQLDQKKLLERKKLMNPYKLPPITTKENEKSTKSYLISHKHSNSSVTPFQKSNITSIRENNVFHLKKGSIESIKEINKINENSTLKSTNGLVTPKKVVYKLSKNIINNVFNNNSCRNPKNNSHLFTTTGNEEQNKNMNKRVSTEIHDERKKKNNEGDIGVKNKVDLENKINKLFSNRNDICSIKSFAANTHPGIIRPYNEDRVAIILNILPPKSRIKKNNWPNCSFFAIYDGHGGTKCAEYLRDNLHNFVITSEHFPSDPKKAIFEGFANAEKNFVEIAQSQNILDRSGSCAVIALIIDQMCYIANVGDSRAIMSIENGAKIIPLSKDHKPCEESEKQRIIQNGGKIYQSQTQLLNKNSVNSTTISGPFRVFPGRLSVSRTFGDAEAKLPKYGGNPNVVIAEPVIKCFEIQKDVHDFVVLGCDGIFDKLSNKDALQTVWNTQKNHNFKNIHEFTGKATENLMRAAVEQKTLDNITVVMLGFKNIKNLLFSKKNNNLTSNNQIKITNEYPLAEYSFCQDNPNEAIDNELFEKE